MTYDGISLPSYYRFCTRIIFNGYIMSHWMNLWSFVYYLSICVASNFLLLEMDIFVQRSFFIFWTVSLGQYPRSVSWVKLSKGFFKLLYQFKLLSTVYKIISFISLSLPLSLIIRERGNNSWVNQALWCCTSHISGLFATVIFLFVFSLGHICLCFLPVCVLGS